MPDSGGGGYGQLRLGTWVSGKPIGGQWRLAADAELVGTAVGGGRASASGSITGEALYVAPRWGGGFGVGPTSGLIAHSLPVTALHARLRGWWGDPAATTTLTWSIEPNRFLDAWFTDISGGWVRRQGRWTTQLTASARVSSAFVSRAAALFSVDYRLSSTWSVSAIGGNVLPDPYQGFPATGVLFAGARLQLPLRHVPRTAVVRGTGFAITHGADGVTLEFERQGAQSVAIAGDWNSWLPTPLDTSRPDRWVVHLSLAPGVYHFTMLIDGNAWTIPSGVPSVPDGMGGRVAVLVVTP
ncbi:MAG TPA: glycogen-binding domain-containing protein [Gemmatimonadales bacterium]|nr:glycogen-binding domain-containing protein [Gemmatimonadales bacterium]